MSKVGDLRLPDVPKRSPEQEHADRQLLKAYFNSDRTEPTPEEIKAYCTELKNDPEWVRLFFDNLDRKQAKLYMKPTHRMKVEND